jgi:hypothetical protein
MKSGTRSESREGTRWMGKHVEVDFVDSIQPSIHLESTTKLLLLPLLLLSIPLAVAYTS